MESDEEEGSGKNSEKSSSVMGVATSDEDHDGYVPGSPSDGAGAAGVAPAVPPDVAGVALAVPPDDPGVVLVVQPDVAAGVDLAVPSVAPKLPQASVPAGLAHVVEQAENTKSLDKPQRPPAKAKKDKTAARKRPAAAPTTRKAEGIAATAATSAEQVGVAEKVKKRQKPETIPSAKERAKYWKKNVEDGNWAERMESHLAVVPEELYPYDYAHGEWNWTVCDASLEDGSLIKGPRTLNSFRQEKTLPPKIGTTLCGWFFNGISLTIFNAKSESAIGLGAL